MTGAVSGSSSVSSWTPRSRRCSTIASRVSISAGRVCSGYPRAEIDGSRRVRELLLQLRHQAATFSRVGPTGDHRRACRNVIGYRRRVSPPEVRRYGVQARSTDTFGRVLWSCREQHFVADGPVQNGCPGQAVTPAELFLAGVATCGVELLQVIARANGVPLEKRRSPDLGRAGSREPGAPGRERLQLGAARVRAHRRDPGAGRGAGRELQAQVTALRQRRSCDAGRAGGGSRHRLTGKRTIGRLPGR